jgi:5-methylcytosine-specific restriction endonuclease McrA
MPGWNLSEGDYRKGFLSEDEIWAILNSVFSPKSYKTTTYKFCFLKSLLDNIFNVDENLTISFEELFLKFTEVYWSLIAKHKLCQIQGSSQRQKSSVEIIIINFLNEYKLDGDLAFEGLKKDFQFKLMKKVGSECSKYVIGAFFADTRESFFSFSKSSRTITFNPYVYEMFIKYKYIIEKLNYYEWIKFLEKVNPSETAYAIAEKLDYSAKRNNLSKYKEYLLDQVNQQDCFYCGKKISNLIIEVDHYIPWSFVKDDKLWNFVLACRDCNNKKRDKLANNFYTPKLIERNRYILLDNKNRDIFVGNDFKGYNNNKIESMYESAVFNGFDYGWKPPAIHR